MNKTRIFFLVILFTLAGCSTMTMAEKEQKRNALDDMAKQIIVALVEQDAEIQEKLDNSLAYAVSDMKLTKVPIVGAGGGEGVFIDKRTQQRIYFTVSRLDFWWWLGSSCL